jgi:hypothetical protein
MIGELLPADSLRPNSVDLPGLAQLAAASAIPWTTSLVMHSGQFIPVETG